MIVQSDAIELMGMTLPNQKNLGALWKLFCRS